MIEIALNEVCDYFQLTEDEVVGRDRSRHLVTARRSFFWLSVSQGLGSLNVISKRLGRNHATALHHFKKFKDFCSIGDEQTLKIRKDLLERFEMHHEENTIGKKIKAQKRINDLEEELKTLKKYAAA
jgi:chromosomal replication initiation ATPase DnaA